MAANGSGGIPVDWEAFDALPLPLRRVMNCAPRSFAPETVYAAWKRSGYDADKYARVMVLRLRQRFPSWRLDAKYLHGVL